MVPLSFDFRDCFLQPEKKHSWTAPVREQKIFQKNNHWPYSSIQQEACRSLDHIPPASGISPLSTGVFQNRGDFPEDPAEEWAGTPVRAWIANSREGVQRSRSNQYRRRQSLDSGFDPGSENGDALELLLSSRAGCPEAARCNSGADFRKSFRMSRSGAGRPRERCFPGCRQRQCDGNSIHALCRILFRRGAGHRDRRLLSSGAECRSRDECPDRPSTTTQNTIVL